MELNIPDGGTHRTGIQPLLILGGSRNIHHRRSVQIKQQIQSGVQAGGGVQCGKQPHVVEIEVGRHI